MNMSSLTSTLTGAGAPVYVGYPATGAVLPYVVQRPMIVDTEDVALCGQALDWDFQFAAYCCGGSVEASYNLALRVIAAVQGTHIGGSTLSASTGYVGAQVEGHYETQVTIQVHQGALS